MGRYSLNDEQFIRKNYGTMTASQLAEQLGRTRRSVQRKLQNMGVKLDPEEAKARRAGGLRSRVERGMCVTCPDCGVGPTRVISSRWDEGARETKRRRLCEACLGRWTTREFIVEPDNPQVVVSRSEYQALTRLRDAICSVQEAPSE
jgi:hypothetical protein